MGAEKCIKVSNEGAVFYKRRSLLCCLFLDNHIKLMIKLNEIRKDYDLMTDNNRAPLYEALKEYYTRQDVSFHVPGHKDGQAYRRYMNENDVILTNIMEMDTTEIKGTDDLHHPEGVIRDAQQLAAQLFGAEETFFLVGGSTAGNLALILSVCTEPGDVLLVQRNVHKSIIHGLMLAQANAVFLAPQLDRDSGLMTIPFTQTVDEALQRYPEAKGLLVTNPNYYGMAGRLAPLVELCHANGIPLLVDEAHGAHFGLHPDLPKCALDFGADGVVQSTHKMLTAMTMGAMLHIQGDLLDRNVVRQRLAMVQSSSPSYPIMASLDVSRYMIQSQGADFFTDALALAKQMVEEDRDFQRLLFLRPGACHEDDAYRIQDPFKIVLYDRKGLWTGYSLQEALEAEGCIPEMSDERYVVLAFSPATTGEDAERLRQALRNIDNMMHVSTWNIGNMTKMSDNAQKALDIEVDSEIDLDIGDTDQPYIEAVSEKVRFNLSILPDEDIESVPIEVSEGYLSAEMIIPYPPGIPLLYAGERISAVTARRLIHLRNTRAKCQGAADPTLATIKVIRT